MPAGIAMSSRGNEREKVREREREREAASMTDTRSCLRDALAPDTVQTARIDFSISAIKARL